VVAAVDVRSHTTGYAGPSASTQGTFAPEVIIQVCASLPTLTPVGVLSLLLSILVPLKGRSFTGGVSIGEVAFQAEGGHVRDCQDQAA
jgi:hypothetical protein